MKDNNWFLRGFLLLAFVSQFLADHTFAQWSTNPGINNAIRTGFGRAERAGITGDGFGGMIIVWEDNRVPTWCVYAQRIDASGWVQWTINGTPISGYDGDKTDPRIVTDGAGGAIIAWEDRTYNSHSIRAQRVNAAGALQWPVSVAVSPRGRLLIGWPDPSVISDGSGGAIVTWWDAGALYAQCINGSGAIQWDSNGVAVSPVGYHPETMVSDGQGGALMVWGDYILGVYVQRISNSGIVEWGSNGTRIARGGEYPSIVSDGFGGAIAAWEDYRNGNRDIYAQRINHSGAALWDSNGVAATKAVDHQYSPALASDSKGGAIVVWYDTPGNPVTIQAQRISASGGPPTDPPNWLRLKGGLSPTVK